jgi:hypothetical protein
MLIDIVVVHEISASLATELHTATEELGLSSWQGWDFNVLHSNQNNFGALPVSYLVGTGLFSHG